MTYKELQDFVIRRRFKEAQRTDVKSAMNAIEAQIWYADDWSFRKVAPTTLTLLPNVWPSANLPTDFGHSLKVYDQNGEPLSGQGADEFFGRYMSSKLNGQPGPPEAYTIVDKRFYAGPQPDQAYAYQIRYERPVVHLDLNSVVVVGPMVNDTDTPYWPSEHHLVLGLATTELMYAGMTDISSLLIDSEATKALEAMRAALGAEDHGSENLQYGADTLGSGWGY